MHIYIDFFGLHIASYGLMILIGVSIANIIVRVMAKRKQQDFNDFIILESYCFLGAFLGAKLLYILVSFRYIDWSRIGDLQYLKALFSGGFVFYGGLIGGILTVILVGKIYKIPAGEYIRDYIFLIPLVHAFGRIGCFMAGCCYGIRYSGLGAVVFPSGCFAPSGVKLFPVQIVEAAGLMAIAMLILGLQMRFSWKYTVETYLFLYGILRFILENYRNDTARGIYWNFSTSQWISLGMILFSVVCIMFKRYQIE